MLKNKALFETEPIPKAVVKIAVPMVLSMLVVIIYNMADTFFIGQTGDPNQVAAVSLSMPLFLIFLALGNMFGIGGSSFISRSMGAGDIKKAKSISSFCFYGSIILGIIMIGVFLGSMPFLLKMIGSSVNTEGFAREYLIYLAIGAPFIILANALPNIARSEGAAREAMFGMMLGSITNIVLDPIMIIGMNMGVKGAAIATVIGNIASTIYFVHYFVKKSKMLSISPGDFTVQGGIFTGVIAIGVPASLNNLLMSAANVVLNNFLVKYGDLPVAAMGVAMKANMLIILLQIGMAVGVQPLIGYNYGAKNFKRMKGVIKFTALCLIIFSCIFTVIYFFASSRIIEAFIKDEGVIRYGVPILRIMMVSAPVLGILFIVINALQAMGKATASLLLTLCRQGLIFIPIIFVLNTLFQLNGVIWAQVTADIVSIIVSVALFAVVVKRAEKKSQTGSSNNFSTLASDSELG